MRTLPRMIPMLAATIILAGCTDDADVKIVSAPTTASCADLVGEPVRTNVGCGDYLEPGTAGCYHDGQRVGLWYWLSAADGRLIYGVPGGRWQAGPGDTSMTDMAADLGCGSS